VVEKPQAEPVKTADEVIDSVVVEEKPAPKPVLEK